MSKNLLQQVMGPKQIDKANMDALIQKINSGYIAKRGPRHQQKKALLHLQLPMGMESVPGIGI